MLIFFLRPRLGQEVLIVNSVCLFQATSIGKVVLATKNHWEIKCKEGLENYSFNIPLILNSSNHSTNKRKNSKYKIY